MGQYFENTEGKKESFYPKTLYPENYPQRQNKTVFRHKKWKGVVYHFCTLPERIIKGCASARRKEKPKEKMQLKSDQK